MTYNPCDPCPITGGCLSVLKQRMCDRDRQPPPPCLHCGSPWESCLIHTEFCCDTCAHFEPPTEVPF